MLTSLRCTRTYSLVTSNLSCVQHLRVMLVADMCDHAFLLKMPDCCAGNRAIHFQTLADNGRRDQLRLWNLLQKSVIGWLIEHDQVSKLLLEFTLAPLLIFRTTT